MPARRRTHNSAPLRSSLTNAALVVEERVIWGGSDALRSTADVARWPFERGAWAIERGLIWPLQERTGKWSVPLRAAGMAALVLLAVGAGLLGFSWAAGSGSAPKHSVAVTPIAAPILPSSPQAAAPTPQAPALQGAKPDFTRAVPGQDTAATGKASTATGSETQASSGEGTNASHAAATAEDPSRQSPPADASKVVPAGPAATAVANRFADAFVLYETGRADAAVRTAFGATATPRLARSLLRRPPRLPANVEVPRAKVLNVVPGPKHGDTYTLSVSLLRVGVTSELRIDMERDPNSGEWRVTDVLG